MDRIEFSAVTRVILFALTGREMTGVRANRVYINEFFQNFTRVYQRENVIRYVSRNDVKVNGQSRSELLPFARLIFLRGC